MQEYYKLAKPERTLTNVLTAAAGYLFASHWHINWAVFAALIIGSTFIIASACVFNNLLDQRLDRQMLRTQKRALVEGRISNRAAVIYASLLGMLGFIILSGTNWLTFAIGVEAFLSYVLLYGWAKRSTIYSTLIGTLPGGSSIVAGYTAYSDRLNRAAALLFIAMLTWQMAHFYAIAVYRIKDYRAAKLPVYPVKKGIHKTVQQIIFYICLFGITMVAFSVFGYTGYSFLIGMVGLSLLWLRKALSEQKNKKPEQWAKQVFLFSLTVITTFCVAIALGPILP